MSIAKLLVEVGVKEGNLKKEIGEDNELFRDFAHEVQNATSSVKTQEQALTSLVAKSGNYKQILRRSTQDVQNLSIAYSKLTQEERDSDFGREMAAQLEQSKQKAAELTDTLGDLKAEIRNLADDELNMKAFNQGVGLVRDGLSSVISLTTLFGGENKKLEAVITKLTAVITTANTVIGIMSALHKESYLRIVANRISQSLLTRAMNGYTVATTEAAAATGALAIAQKALPIMAIVGTIATVIGVLYELVSASEDAKEAEDKKIEAWKKGKEKQMEYAREVGRSAGQMVVSYNKLTAEYKNLRTQAQKTEWIQKNASEFSKLGLKIRTVNDAEKIFNGNTGQVVRALQMRAQAMALEQKMLKAYEDYYTKDQELSTYNRKVWKKGDEVPRETLEKAGLKPNALSLSGDKKVYSQHEIDALNEYEAKKALQLNQEKRRLNKQTLDEEVAYITKKTDELSKKVPKGIASNFQLTGEPDNTTKNTTKSSKETEKAKTEIQKLEAELKKLEDARKDGFDTRPVVEYETQVRALKQQLADKKFMLTIDASPAEASVKALKDKLQELYDYMGENQDKLTKDQKKMIDEAQKKVGKELVSRNFQQKGTSTPNWRQTVSSDDLKKRQEKLRSTLQERIPENKHTQLQSNIDAVRAKIKVETDETALEELRAHLQELQTELANTPFKVELTPDDIAIKEEISDIQKELDQRELTLGLDDQKLAEQMKLLAERASKIQMTPQYSSFEKATGVPEQDQKDLSGKNGTDAQLGALQGLMDFYDDLKQSLIELQGEYAKLGPAGQEAFDQLGAAVKNV